MPEVRYSVEVNYRDGRGVEQHGLWRTWAEADAWAATLDPRTLYDVRIRTITAWSTPRRRTMVGQRPASTEDSS